MKTEHQNILFGFLLLSLILANMIIYTGLILIFFDANPNVLIGVFGFWGAAIAGYVAYASATRQIKAQNDKSEEKEVKDSRSYIVLEELMANQRLDGVITNPNSKILTNEFYDQIRDSLRPDASIPFLKIHHTGKPELVLECHITISVRGIIKSLNEKDYIIESYLSVLEKGVEIFLPISNLEYEQLQVISVTMKYKTTKGEVIFYKMDFDKNKETHEIITYDEKGFILNREVLYQVDAKPVDWIYPAKFIDE